MLKIKLLVKNIFIISSLLFIYIFKRSELKKVNLLNDNYCCVISLNRSGASLLSSLICQNEQVHLVDGFFGKKSPKKSSTNKYGHTYGFAESNIWKYINSINGEAFLNRDGYSIWAHPKFLSYFYKDKSLLEFLMKIELKLIISSYGYSKNKLFLIKDPYNILRLKLIKKILPNCKIIINQRNNKEYVESCLHLWSKNYQNLLIDKDISLHWYLSNVIGIYDAEMNFKNIFKINHEDLYDFKIPNDKIMKKIEAFLKINKKDSYNYDEINTDKSFLKAKKNQWKFNKIKVNELVNYEKKIIDKFK